MSKATKIDLSGDRLIAIAADMLDDHNYIGALKMLNKNAVISGNDADSYMLYAEIFDDMGLYERSVHSWFKYMDLAASGELADCLEGLAVGYMNLGNEHFAAYYYNKLLLETNEVDAATREQIVQDFLSCEENPLKFSYPPEIADVTDIMAEGISSMKQGDFDKALEQFEAVPFGNPKWSAARNYIAMCYVVKDDCESAERECLSVLEKDGENVQALATLAAVKCESGNREEARAITQKLLCLDIKDADDIFKIATVCCENKMHAEAYSLFCKMDGTAQNDLNILYFKAISAFNSKQFDRGFEAFDRLLTIYPDAVTAQFYYRAARQRAESEWEELSYFYSLPQDLKQSSLKMLAAFIKLPKKQAARLADELNILGPVKWCFDEANPNNAEELQSLAAQVAIKAKMDDYVRDLLLHPFIADKLKIEMLESLCERGESNEFGVVICNVFKRVSMRKLYTGIKKRTAFTRAYSRLVAHFSILDDSYGERFAVAAEKFYGELFRAERLDAAKDIDALTAVIFQDAQIADTGITKENIIAFFDVSQERIDLLRGTK